MPILLTIIVLLWSPPNVPEPSVWDTQEVVMNLAFCESSLNPNAYVKDDAGSPSIGLLQFKQKTWDWASKRYGFKGDIWSPEDQKIVASFLLDEGRFSHWAVCSRKLGLKDKYETKI